MDFMFVGAEGTFVDELRAKATVLMVICKDDGNLSTTEVRVKTDEYGVEMVLRFLSTYESVEIKTDGGPASSRLLEGYRLEATKQRLWHRRVLEDTKKLEQWNVRMEQCRCSCERITWTCKNVSFQVRSCSHGSCGIQFGRWCATSPIRERNRPRMREQEVVNTNQRWYHLEKWSWRKLQTLTR